MCIYIYIHTHTWQHGTNKTSPLSDDLIMFAIIKQPYVDGYTMLYHSFVVKLGGGFRRNHAVGDGSVTCG